LVWQLGVQTWARGEYQRAIGILEQSAHLDPVDPMQLGLLGQAYYESGDYKIAIQLWERAGASVPLYDKGNRAQEAGRFQEAIQFLEASLRVDSNQPHAHYFMAYAYYRLGNPNRAVTEAQEAIRLDGGRNLGYRAQLAWIHEMTGDPGLARQEYLEILSLAPDHPSAREGLLRVERILKEQQK